MPVHDWLRSPLVSAGKGTRISGTEPLRRRATDKPPRERRIRQLFERPTAFTNLLPWLEYLPESQSFLLDDGVSVAALFELNPVGVEARPASYLVALRDKLQTVLTAAILEEHPSPWVLQLFLQDEPTLRDLADSIETYAQPEVRTTALTQAYLTELRGHLGDISRPGGLFQDEGVTGGPWRGTRRMVRACLYRHRYPGDNRLNRRTLSPEEELTEVAGKFTVALQTAGVRVKRLGGEDLYAWLVRWFNPNPVSHDGDTEALLRAAPYPGDQAMPYGHDFAESLMLAMPYSDAQTGTWWFDGLPHKVVTVQSLRRAPEMGLLGAERAIGEHVFAVFDRLPEGTVMAMTVTLKAQDAVRNHLASIQRAAVGDYPEAVLAGHDAERAQLEIAQGNKLYPVQLVFYLRGVTTTELRAHLNATHSVLIAHGLQPILERDDLNALDSYIRNLPMRYSVQHDQTEARRSRLMYGRHAANLLPLYGRSRGTGNPGLLLYNRGGEPVLCDPFNIRDRKKNAHALIVGPTGAGKSALLVTLVLHTLAVYRPRLFIVEAGNSFGLLGDYLETQGLSVNRLSLMPNADVSLPPFGDALHLLDVYHHKRQQLQVTDDESVLEHELEAEARRSANETFDDGEDTRDLLGEMEIAARIMITGGDVREDDRLTRADRLLIRQAILVAARTARDAGRSQVITQDVVNALRKLDDLSTRRRERAVEMADAMALFCDGLAGHFFNRPGVLWPVVDATVVDVGILARESYEDQLAVAYIGLMNHIHGLVERQQNDQRPTLVVTDEGHIITTNPLLAPYVIKIVKMWRKLGAWFWIATQNLEDFPDTARRMLSMLEWWFCLVMPKDEIEQIARFKVLSDEQRALLLATRKSPGQYTEGVLLSDHLAALFRNVPPPLALALAMTEKDEKAERHALMREHGINELDAVRRIATTIAERRQAGD